MAADNAHFATAYAHIALSPDGGGTWFLPPIVGQRNAADLLLLSERVNAQQALKLGLIYRIVALADFDAGTAGLTEHVKDGPLRAYCETKRLLTGSADRTLADQLQAQAGGFACCAATLGLGEGVRAFLERRKPSFPGR